jgi:hypothetical protein
VLADTSFLPDKAREELAEVYYHIITYQG